ncbi:hypothetical protein [Imhoffiella purpurea]|uniref:Uncharacterized protein n=1 Tax=Imhoffiella purpurea TaxID=1249627 RepID=W9VHE5_9GAMM|nr:hypothetical protein [Imhoffiella purpurea]EXJ16421.1 hypothetical protein D779_0153 [Imhoffiella purpurea]
MTEIIDAQQLVARTLGLLSRAAIDGVCKGRLKELVLHLECVAGDQSLDPSIRGAAEGLSAEWKRIYDREFGETTELH